LKQSYDVIIVGAGPAGAMLAYELAKNGVDVLVLEKETLPRYKCCAGGVTSKAAKLLGFDFSDAVENVVYEVNVGFDLSNSYLRRHNEPLMYMVMRDAFDYLLAKRAQQAGAVLIDGQEATEIQVSGDWVQVYSGDKVFRSRLVVGADGAYSIAAREMDMRRSLEYIMGIESEVAVSEAKLAKWKSRALLDLGCVPGGYAWVFPKRNHLSVGVGCIVSKAKQLRGCYDRFLKSLGFDGYTVVRSSSHLIPTCSKGRFVWQDKALLVGDAAGLADPLTGEGIHGAILSAELAASVIKESLSCGKVNLEDYQKAVDEKILSELRIARVLSRIFVHFPHLSFTILKQSERVWKASCGLMSGELTYAELKRKAGGFKSIYARLLRA